MEERLGLSPKTLTPFCENGRTLIPFRDEGSSRGTTLLDGMAMNKVELRGFEPLTPCLPGKCSPAELQPRNMQRPFRPLEGT